MARDNIKEIIERGRQIPSPESHLLKPVKSSKVNRSALLDEKPKESKHINTHRTLRGSRK